MQGGRKLPRQEVDTHPRPRGISARCESAAPRRERGLWRQFGHNKTKSTPIRKKTKCQQRGVDHAVWHCGGGVGVGENER